MHMSRPKQNAILLTQHALGVTNDGVREYIATKRKVPSGEIDDARAIMQIVHLSPIVAML